MTPLERARELFEECRRQCTCGGGVYHCGRPTPEDMADAIADAIRAERETCLDIIRGYAQDCGCSSVIEAAILAIAEERSLTREEERAARWGDSSSSEAGE